jgi:hypothetical protein
VTAVSEAGAHAEEILSGGRTFDRGPEAEERVVLYSTFPQMFASLLVPQPENTMGLMGYKIQQKTALCMNV